MVLVELQKNDLTLRLANCVIFVGSIYSMVDSVVFFCVCKDALYFCLFYFSPITLFLANFPMFCKLFPCIRNRLFSVLGFHYDGSY